MTTLAMMAVAALAWIGPEPYVVRETFAQIEINHRYDEHGQHVFDQLLFRDWHAATCELEIVDWRLVKQRSILPVRGRCLWWDGDAMRDVRSVSVKETWTQLDPEVEERAWLEKKKRPELLPAKPRREQ